MTMLVEEGKVSGWAQARCGVCGGSFAYDVSRDCPATCGQFWCIAMGTWSLSRWEGQWRMALARAGCGIEPQALDLEAAKRLGLELPKAPVVPTSRRRLRRYAERSTQWLDPGRAGLAGVLTKRVDAGADRVYLLGREPGGGGIDGLRRWVFAKMPAGWEAGAHYLDDTAAPVLRFTRPDGRRLDVYRGAQWFGDDEAVTPAAAEAAMGVVDVELRRAFGCGPLATPGTTGREMFARSIPDGVEWPTLPAELQDLVRSTSGQGRIEACPAVEQVSRVVELDGRLMYAALCNELGAGPAVHDRGDEYLGYAPARYRVKFMVPVDWAHVGILPVKDERGGWSYPSTPGTSWETWADGAELHVAYQHGWPILILERIVYAKGRPLDAWAKTLTGIAQRHAGDELVRAAVRSILLHAIGAFHGRPHTVTRTVTSARSREIPTGVRDVQKLADGRLVWQEQQAPAWPEMAHPEWSSRVWARARARLLDGPGGAGALNVARSSVLGFLTDAVYLDHDPSWPDDGRAGRYRVKSDHAVNAPAPRTHRDLVALRGDPT